MYRIFLTFALALMLVGSASALTDYYWTGGGDGSSWNDAANWGGTVPTIAESGQIDLAGAVVNINASAAAFRSFIGETTGTATLNVNADFTVDKYIAVGKTATGVGTMNVYSGTINTSGLSVGDAGNGTLNMYGGSIVIGGSASGIAGAWANDGTGHIQLDGGTLDFSATALRMATTSNATATLDITGGTLILAGTVTDLEAYIQGTGVAVGTWSVSAYSGSGSFVYTQVGGNTEVTAVPEPMTIALLGLGGLFLRKRK